MKVQKTGQDSVLLVLHRKELENWDTLRCCAQEALEREGIAVREAPELTVYTMGELALVFARAGDGEALCFSFDAADALLDAAYESERLFPEAGAKLCRKDGRFYLVTTSHHAAELLREYAKPEQNGKLLLADAEVILAHHAFQILSGRC